MVVEQSEPGVEAWVDWARVNARLCLTISDHIIGGRCGEFPLDISSCIMSNGILEMNFSDKANLRIVSPVGIIIRHSGHADTKDVLEVTNAAVAIIEWYGHHTPERREEVYRFTGKMVERQYSGPPRRYPASPTLLRQVEPAIRLEPYAVRVDGHWKLTV